MGNSFWKCWAIQWRQGLDVSFLSSFFSSFLFLFLSFLLSFSFLFVKGIVRLVKWVKAWKRLTLLGRWKHMGGQVKAWMGMVLIGLLRSEPRQHLLHFLFFFSFISFCFFFFLFSFFFFLCFPSFQTWDFVSFVFLSVVHLIWALTGTRNTIWSIIGEGLKRKEREGKRHQKK